MIRIHSIVSPQQRTLLKRNTEKRLTNTAGFSSTLNLRSSTLRIRRNLSLKEPRPELLLQLKKLYKAKCKDIGIPILPEQQQRFLTSCQSNFKNRRFLMKDMNLGVATAKAIGQILALSSRFAYINVSKNVFGDKGSATLVKYLLTNTNMVHLDLSSNDITSEGSAKVLRSLTPHPTMVSLDLSSHEGLHRNRLGAAGASALGEFFEANQIITHVNIAGTSIGSEGLHLLLDGLSKNTSLLSLDISNNGICHGEMSALCEVLVNSQIKWLNLSNNKIGNDGCFNLASLASGSFDGPCPLKVLNISNNQISIKGLLKLFAAMRMNISLETLNLDNNNFLQGLSSEFTPFMHCNKVLKNLSLNGCSIPDIEGQTICEGLLRNNSLLSLDLAHNKIGNLGVEAICYALSKSSALKSLNLASNKIKWKGGVVLAKALQKNKSIEKLNLSDNRLSNLIGEHFIEMTRINKKILCIKLENNSLDIKNINQINSNLKRNVQLRRENLVPQLRSTIGELQIGTSKKSHIQSYIRVLEKEKRDMKHRLNNQTLKFEDVRELEEKKTDTVVEERESTKQMLMEKNKEFTRIQEDIKITESKILRDFKIWGDRTNELVYLIKKAEKEKAKKKMLFNLKRSSTTELTLQLNEELRIQEVALRSAKGTLHTLQLKLKEIKGKLPKREIPVEPISPCKNRALSPKGKQSPTKDKPSTRKYWFSPTKDISPNKGSDSPYRHRNSPPKENRNNVKENSDLIVLFQ